MIKDKLLKVAVVLLEFALIFGMAHDSQAKKPNPANENIVELSSASVRYEVKIISLEINIVPIWNLKDLKDYPAGEYKLETSGKAEIEIWRIEKIDEEEIRTLDGKLKPSVKAYLIFDDGTVRLVKMNGKVNKISSEVKNIEAVNYSVTLFGKSVWVSGSSFKGEWNWDEKKKKYGDKYEAVLSGGAKVTLSYTTKSGKVLERSRIFPLPPLRVQRKISHLVLYDYKADPKMFCPGDERFTTISSNINYAQDLKWEIDIKGTGIKVEGDKLSENGDISWKWDGKDNKGEIVKPGKYEYTISARIEDEAGKRIVTAKTIDGEKKAEGEIIVGKVEIQETDKRYSEELIAEQGKGTDANIKYEILSSKDWTPYSVTLKIRQNDSDIRSKDLSINLGEQETAWDGKDDSSSYVNVGTYDATIEVAPTEGADPIVSNVHKMVVVDGIFKAWADASKKDLDKVVKEKKEPGLRSEWNSFVRRYAILKSTETQSDAAISQGTTIPSTSLLDKIFDIIADKETSKAAADGKASPFDIGPPDENSYGVTQITDGVMGDRGKTYQDNIDGDLTAKTTIIAFGEYLNILSTDERSDTQSCFEVSIDQMEWLDNNYIDVNTSKYPHGHYQLGDNKESAEILAAGWNGGWGAIKEGFGGDAIWKVEHIQNKDAKKYAKDVGARAYP